MKRRVASVVIACGLLSSVGLLAQTQARGPGLVSNYTPASTWKKRDFQVGFWRMAKVSRDYVLGAGDEIQIGIYGVAALSDMMQSTKITNAGEVTIPLLGTLRASGLTAEQLEASVSDALKAKHLIENPEVLVTVLEYQAKPIYVIGEVDNPGQYVMSQPWTMSEAILIAGGLDISAANFGYLHRRVASGATMPPPPGTVQAPEVAMPGYQVTRLDLRSMKTGGVLQPDIPLQVGDVLVVPPRRIDVAFVIGDVGKEGAVELPEEARLPVSRALSAAGGPRRTAKMSQGILVRYEADGQRKEVPVDYAAVLTGQQPDFEVRPNDIIFVPGSKGKSVGFSLLSAIPTIVQNAAILALVP